MNLRLRIIKGRGGEAIARRSAMAPSALERCEALNRRSLELARAIFCRALVRYARRQGKHCRGKIATGYECYAVRLLLVRAAVRERTRREAEPGQRHSQLAQERFVSECGPSVGTCRIDVDVAFAAISARNRDHLGLDLAPAQRKPHTLSEGDCVVVARNRREGSPIKKRVRWARRHCAC